MIWKSDDEYVLKRDFAHYWFELPKLLFQSGKPLSMTCRMERKHSSRVMPIISAVLTRRLPTLCVCCPRLWVTTRLRTALSNSFLKS